MKFSVAELTKSLATKPLSFSETVDVSELATSKENDIRAIGPVEVTGMVTLEKRNFIFSFTISGEMTLPCARTLVDVIYPFRFHVTEIFTNVANLDPEGEEVHHIENDTIDLYPYILENILLQMPYRVFSDEKGLIEGEGWQLYTEEQFTEEQANKVDPRMEKLKQWLDKQ